MMCHVNPLPIHMKFSLKKSEKKKKFKNVVCCSRDWRLKGYCTIGNVSKVAVTLVECRAWTNCIGDPSCYSAF